MRYISWLYFLVENQGVSNERVIFLYGLSLPTKIKQFNKIKSYSEKIDTNREIVIFSNICETGLSVANGFLDFNGFVDNKKIKSKKIINYKESIQVVSEVNRDIPNSPVITPLYIKCFYTDEFYIYYDKQNIETSSIESIRKILKVLENISGQNFTTVYAKRLGCYEIGETQAWAEEKVTPFLIDTQQYENTIKYVLKIDKDYEFKQITIHLMVYNSGNEVIRDIIKSSNNEKEVFLAEIMKNGNASLEYWIFDDNGKLIDRNKYGFIHSVSLNAKLIDETYHIDQKNYSSKSPLNDKSRSVSTYTDSFQNNIEVDKIHDIEEKANKLYQRLKTFNEEDQYCKNGAWFDVGEHENIINFLNKVTLNGAYKITFIDPFISSDASLDYLYHFQNQQLSIRFISCWKKTNASDSIDNLQARLEGIQDFNIPLKTAQWFNLKASKFHDRFIYIENVSNREKQVYSMSNSLNNMLKRYSLLITPLKGEVLLKALTYIEGLFSECNDSNQIYPSQENKL